VDLTPWSPAVGHRRCQCRHGQRRHRHRARAWAPDEAGIACRTERHPGAVEARRVGASSSSRHDAYAAREQTSDWERDDTADPDTYRDDRCGRGVGDAGASPQRRP